MDTSSIFNSELKQKDQSVDYKALFYKVLSNWYLFVIAILVSLALAFLFNKFTKSVYKVQTTMVIKGDRRNMIDPQEMLGLGPSDNTQDLQTEIGILKSRYLISRTIQKLSFYVSYYRQDNFLLNEIYKTCPFTVEFDSTHKQPVSNLKFNITILSKKEFQLSADGQEISLYNYNTFTEDQKHLIKVISIKRKVVFGTQLIDSAFSFKVVLNPNFIPSSDIGKNYQFAFNSLNSLISVFSEYAVEPINKEAMIVSIALNGNSDLKSVDFLNTLTSEYIQLGLEKKNRIAINTIRFIDSQLNDIGDTLRSNESQLQNFQASKEIMDLDAQSQQAYVYISQLQSQKADVMVKLRYYRYLQNYLQQNNDDVNKMPVPSSLGIEDPVLNTLVDQLTGLYSERSQRLVNLRETSPVIVALNNRIRSAQKSLLENISVTVSTSEMTLRDLEAK